jgi:hypothetical protein
MTPGWHITDQGGALILSRRATVRWDIRVEATLPTTLSGAGLSRRRLAQQIRQDMWRVLQSVRGFLPAVQISARATDHLIVAGGDLDGTQAPLSYMEGRIAELLADPVHIARWTSHARRRASA